MGEKKKISLVVKLKRRVLCPGLPANSQSPLEEYY